MVGYLHTTDRWGSVVCSLGTYAGWLEAGATFSSRLDPRWPRRWQLLRAGRRRRMLRDRSTSHCSFSAPSSSICCSSTHELGLRSYDRSPLPRSVGGRSGLAAGTGTARLSGGLLQKLHHWAQWAVLAEYGPYVTLCRASTVPIVIIYYYFPVIIEAEACAKCFVSY